MALYTSIYMNSFDASSNQVPGTPQQAPVQQPGMPASLPAVPVSLPGVPAQLQPAVLASMPGGSGSQALAGAGAAPAPAAAGATEIAMAAAQAKQLMTQYSQDPFKLGASFAQLKDKYLARQYQIMPKPAGD